MPGWSGGEIGIHAALKMLSARAGVGSSPTRTTMERKCVEPTVVGKSGGRAPCPDIFKVGFLDKGKCFNCPKVKGILPSRIPVSKADSDAWEVRRWLGYS